MKYTQKIKSAIKLLREIEDENKGSYFTINKLKYFVNRNNLYQNENYDTPVGSIKNGVIIFNKRNKSTKRKSSTKFKTPKFKPIKVESNAFVTLKDSTFEPSFELSNSNKSSNANRSMFTNKSKSNSNKSSNANRSMFTNKSTFNMNKSKSMFNANKESINPLFSQTPLPSENSSVNTGSVEPETEPVTEPSENSSVNTGSVELMTEPMTEPMSENTGSVEPVTESVSEPVETPDEHKED